MMDVKSSCEPPVKRFRLDDNMNHTSAPDATPDSKFDERRVHLLSNTMKVAGNHGGGVLYWMCRDQRVQDNWAVSYAQKLALEKELPLHICFCLEPKMFLKSAGQHSLFMAEGLRAVAAECQNLNIQFHLLDGESETFVPELAHLLKVDAVVTDFSPLRESIARVGSVKGALPQDLPFYQVDARNVVPVRVAAAGRNNIRDLLREFLTEIPFVTEHPYLSPNEAEVIDWQATLQRFIRNPNTWETPGSSAGLAKSRNLIKNRLTVFLEKKDDPHFDPLTDLNLWLQFGQISAHRFLLDVNKYKSNVSALVKAGIEVLVEAIVRRQLTDNFCLFNGDFEILGMDEQTQDEHLLLESIKYSGSKGLWLTDFQQLNPHMTDHGSTEILEKILGEKRIKLAIEPEVWLLRKMEKKLYFLSHYLVPFQQSHFVAPFFSRMPPWFFCYVYKEKLFKKFSDLCLKFLKEALDAAAEADDETRSYLSSGQLLLKLGQTQKYFEFSFCDVKFILQWLIQEKKVEKVIFAQNLIRYRIFISAKAPNE